MSRFSTTKVMSYAPTVYYRRCGPLPLTTLSIRFCITVLQARYPIALVSMFSGAGIMVRRVFLSMKLARLLRVVVWTWHVSGGVVASYPRRRMLYGYWGLSCANRKA